MSKGPGLGTGTGTGTGTGAGAGAGAGAGTGVAATPLAPPQPVRPRVSAATAAMPTVLRCSIMVLRVARASAQGSYLARLRSSSGPRASR
ncbi:MAG: hypothetical protein C0423_15605 [Methylibium sp.]|nr:hypothetical protein [Methylibium sp.]